MRKREFKRIGAMVLAAVMTLQCASNLTSVSAADSSVQMSSDKEVVYVNTYNTTEREQNFDDNWKFYLGDASGAENANFDDSAWEGVNLPHDYSIEQDYSQSMEAESAYLPGGTGWYRKHFVVGSELEGKEIRIDFGGVYMNATVWVNGEELGTHPYGYTPFSFDITDYVRFGEENVITVKVEHKTPSSRFYSGSGIYRSVNLTVTDPVHVDLYGTTITTPNLETEQGEVVNMNVETTVLNAGETDASVTLVHTIYEKGTENSIGTVTTDAVAVAAGQTADIAAALPAQNPALWDIASPNLYTVTTEVKVDGAVVDTYDTEYGFRYFSFDNDTGFYLNGEKVKLQGVCMHHDQGSLGAEAYASAINRQVRLLKEMGCNAIRVTHNPAADELIEACNEQGIMVIDEAFDGWLDVKNGNTYDYSNWFDVEIEEGNEIIGAEDGMTWAEFDTKAMVSRGKNSPAVIMWSIGNEVQEGTNWASTSTYPQVASNIISWIQEIDTTRPATNGDNVLKGLGTQSMLSVDANIYASGGVVGANYASGSQYDSIHATYPDWIIYGSETASHVNSRGVYDRVSSATKTSDQQLTSYDYSAVGWGATASSAWYEVIKRDFVAGEFVWTGFDYLGEPTPYNGTSAGAMGYNGTWPSPKSSYFGIIDTAGLPKDNYYFYQSQWNEEVNTLHVLPAWNEDVVYETSSGVPVVVYSDAASVKLEFEAVDGTVTDLGTKTFTTKTTTAGYTYQIYGENSTNHQDLYLTWYVPYEDGTIRAIAYDADGNVITDTEGRSEVTTTDEAYQLHASADRYEIDADGKDLAYITINVNDAGGYLVPDADNRVTVEVEGDGVLVGIDNGNQSDHQSYQDDNRLAYNGSLVAIVQSTKDAGEFTVTAKADGLTSDSVTVTTVSVDDDAATEEKVVDSFYMSKNYYVKVGNKPTLPEKVEVRYTDGTSEELPVVWNEISEEQYNVAGTFGVSGVVDGLYTVSVTINMIDELGGLLNYSTTTSIGVAPTLPDSRPAVAVDGTILNVSFPVDWEDIDAGDYAEAGTFTVTGTANVLGDAMTVTASVRVQEETITVEGSISDQALSLTQDIEASLQSDDLNAIKDGSTSPNSVSEGTNGSIWTNYDSSAENDNTAEIVFEYATQQRFGEIVIHYYKDGWSARYPDAGTTEIWISEDGEDWTQVVAEETIGDEVASGAVAVKPYTYSFSPITATFVKFCITNNSTATDMGAGFACTGITEIELKKATGTFVTNTTADIASMTVNDVELTADEIADGVYYTLETEATVDVVAADNAAVTVLPAYDNKINIIVESEDHKTRETFTIRLGEEAPVDPSDDSNDVPVEQLTAISGSEYPGTGSEGPDDLILDGNAQTHWHTNYNTSDGQDVNKRWVGVELDEATWIGGIRYLPRVQGNGNGAVTEYRVEYREDTTGEWIEVASGTWESSDKEWKYVEFEESVMAKQVRVVGVHTIADGDTLDAHMTTAEFRVVYGEENTDPDQPSVELTPGENYPVENMTLSAGSTQTAGSEGLATDGNTNTFWETRWSTQADNTGKLWFQITLDEAAELDQLLYYPRYQGTNLQGGDQNGFISKYLIEVSMDGTTWTEAAEGEWTAADAWLTADFDAVEAKYVRLTGVETLNNGEVANKDMSIAEIRVRVAAEETPVVVDKTALNAKIDEVADYAETDYTSVTWAAFAEALDAAQEVAEDADATQAQVDEALEALTEAASGLTARANKDALNLTIAAAKDKDEADYTTATWEAFEEALAHAREIAADADVTADEVKEANDALVAAMNALVAKANKEALSEVIVKAKSKTSTDYTEDSWKVVADAITAAEAVANDEDATQAEVDAAIKALTDAIDDLVKVDPETPGTDDKDPVDPETPGTDDKDPAEPETPGTDDKSPTTGDSVSIMGWFMLVAVAAAVIFTTKRRIR